MCENLCENQSAEMRPMQRVLARTFRPILNQTFSRGWAQIALYSLNVTFTSDKAGLSRALSAFFTLPCLHCICSHIQAPPDQADDTDAQIPDDQNGEDSPADSQPHEAEPYCKPPPQRFVEKRYREIHDIAQNKCRAPDANKPPAPSIPHMREHTLGRLPPSLLPL
jgi:hypothetical protein